MSTIDNKVLKLLELGDPLTPASSKLLWFTDHWMGLANDRGFQDFESFDFRGEKYSIEDLYFALIEIGNDEKKELNGLLMPFESDLSKNQIIPRIERLNSILLNHASPETLQNIQKGLIKYEEQLRLNPYTDDLQIKFKKELYEKLSGYTPITVPDDNDSKIDPAQLPIVTFGGKLTRPDLRKDDNYKVPIEKKKIKVDTDPMGYRPLAITLGVIAGGAGYFLGFTEPGQEIVSQIPNVVDNIKSLPLDSYWNKIIELYQEIKQEVLPVITFVKEHLN